MASNWFAFNGIDSDLVLALLARRFFVFHVR